MIPALLATLSFACSAVCGQRLSRLLGGITANFRRLSLATAITWLITLALFRETLEPDTFGWLLLSGFVGFGLGDLGLFLAYPRLGSRITMLVLSCSACILAGLGDWLALRTTLKVPLVCAIGLTLCGLLLALHRPNEPLRWNRGILFAIIAGAGQAGGQVLSRVAQEIARSHAAELPALAQTAQRLLGGWTVSLVSLFLLQAAAKRRESAPEEPAKRKKHLHFWLFGAALFGPVIGVTAMQWALAELRSSALVSAITATAPLLVMPLARLTEGDRPSARAFLGTLLSVAGISWAAWLRR